MPYPGTMPPPSDHLFSGDQHGEPLQPPIVRHGRYRLDDFIDQTAYTQSWRCYDLVLNRTVGVQLIARDHPNFAEVQQAALTAGRVVDRQIVRVIDVVLDDDDLCIVSEWVEGLLLDEFIYTQLTPQQSITITQGVVAAICALYDDSSTNQIGTEAGQGHGRITPQSIIVSPTGEIRIRGHMVQAALIGKIHGVENKSEDIAAAGAVFQACLTATWAAPVESQLEPTPRSGDTYALPGQLRAWLPKSVDTLVAKTRIGSQQFSELNDLRLGLLAIAQELPHDLDADGPLEQKKSFRSNRLLKQTIGVVAAVAAVAILGTSGVALYQSNQSELVASESTNPNEESFDSQAGVLGKETIATLAAPTDNERSLPIIAAWGVNEKPKLLASSTTGALVHDSDITTGWRTKTYPTANIGTDHPDGLLIDLGSIQSVNAVDLDLIGEDSDLTIKIGSKKRLMTGDGTVAATIVSAPSTLILRKARPLTTRYLFIDFTKVPLGENGYQGGVLSLKVLGR